MADLEKASYGSYARQRLVRILLDLKESKKDFNWASAANAISEYRKVHFQRMNFYRLLDGTLGNDNIEIIVSWLEKTIDSEIRARLTPQAIFDEYGTTSRDYFFHISEPNDLDELDKQLLTQYSGVYLCVPAWDRSSYLPLSFLRGWYDDYKSYTHIDRKDRSLDIKQYISERSILILQRTPKYCFYAAEIPLSALFPKEFETGCIKMTYEGIGYLSSNSIHLQLRECLSRVPKSHSILIAQKTAHQKNNPFGLSLHLPPGLEGVRQEWAQLSTQEIEQLKKEYASTIEEDVYLSGPAQITVSPLPSLRNRVASNFSRDYLYHRKPVDFLKDRALHFIRPDLDNTEEVKKIIDNPLSIGELF